MSAKKRHLGRGLDALLGAAAAQQPVADANPSTEPGGDADKTLKELPVDLVQRGKYQPRKDLYPHFLVLLVFGSITQLFDPFLPSYDIEHVDRSQSSIVQHLHHFSNHTVVQKYEMTDERQTQMNDRRELLELLRVHAKIPADTLSAEILGQLPTPQQWEALYGKDIVIRGEETCEQYRKLVEPKNRYFAAAGMFNTGTNLLFKLTSYDEKRLDQQDLDLVKQVKLALKH